MDDSPSSFTEEDFSCPVCREIFKHPVILSCSHSFCRACLREWWTHKDKQCPLCKEMNNINTPPCNRALKNLCETYAKERHEKMDPQKAVEESLVLLQEKLKILKTTCDQTAEHIKVQAQNTERKIREQFEKLHRFLREEEEARIAALREEESKKSRTMKEKIEGLNADISTLSNTIAEGQPRTECGVAQIADAAMERAGRFKLLDQPPPQPLRGALIDEAKYLGNLTYRVWSKMLDDVVSYTPVILDPNTANRELVLSDDLTGVRCREEAEEQLPDNPERMSYWCRVLGSEGFDSGTHSWDVEVGDNADWSLGVLAESFERKGRGGGPLWVALQLNRGELTAESPSRPLVVLSVRRRPRRIRVRLDWDGGELSFSDPDANARLHTFVARGGGAFTGTLFPYVGNTSDANLPLKMLPRKVRIIYDDDDVDNDNDANYNENYNDDDEYC